MGAFKALASIRHEAAAAMYAAKAVGRNNLSTYPVHERQSGCRWLVTSGERLGAVKTSWCTFNPRSTLRPGMSLALRRSYDGSIRRVDCWDRSSSWNSPRRWDWAQR